MRRDFRPFLRRPRQDDFALAIGPRPGQLIIAVADGVSGQLVGSHRPVDWADALTAVALRPQRREHLAAGAVAHALRFSWERTTEALLRVYVDAAAAYRVDALEREVAV